MNSTSTAKPHREPRSAWTGLLLGGVLLLILAVLAVSTIQRVRRGEEMMRNSLTHQALLLVQSLEGASRATMRRGVWRGQVLQSLVEEMAQHPPVIMLAVFDSEGEMLAVGRNQDLLSDRPTGDLPPDIESSVAKRAEVTRFEPDELVVGRPFEPLRRFRLSGRKLPPWACPADQDQGKPPESGPAPGPEYKSGEGFRDKPPKGDKRWRRPGMMMGMGMRMGMRPPKPPHHLRGYALVRLSTQAFQEARSQALQEALLLAGLIFLSAGLVAWGIWAAGRRRDAEISRLRREVAASEHLAAVGRLAGSVAHEVRNPLSAVRGLVQYLAKGEEPGSKKAEHAAAAVSEVDRLERVVSSLLEYTRPREPRLVELDLEDSIRSALNLMSDDPRASGVDIHLNVEPDLPHAQADPDQIRQVLVNLVVNALEALNGRGALDIAVRVAESGIEVEVTDDGPGLPDGDPEQVFDPFFSARERGTGMGLAIARRIIRSHGGELSARNDPDGGACFVFNLSAGGGAS
jgi:signal transduction histidine kinase